MSFLVRSKCNREFGFAGFACEISAAAIDYVYTTTGSPAWAIVWRDTGFDNEIGESQPALDIWRDALEKEHVAATDN